MLKAQEDKGRDVDAIIAMVREKLPSVRVEQLQVKLPADDDGLWLFTLPEGQVEVQIESSTGCSPFLIENDRNADRRTCDSIATTADAIMTLLNRDPDAA